VPALPAGRRVFGVPLDGALAVQRVDPGREGLRLLRDDHGVVVLSQDNPRHQFNAVLAAQIPQQISEPVSARRLGKTAASVQSAGGDEERHAAVRRVRRPVSLLRRSKEPITKLHLVA
jgi:hypothetical protein